MIYLFLYENVYYLADTHPRTTHPGAELLGAYKKIQDAVRAAEKQHLTVISLLKKTWSGVTATGREKMREAKRGDKNPNHAGLSDAHKRKIAATMKKTRRGEHHHFYNMRHSPRSKLKISLGMKRLGARRWALSPEGTEHFVYLPFTLPPGWCWGRARSR
jgi:hypothetical protein